MLCRRVVSRLGRCLLKGYQSSAVSRCYSIARTTVEIRDAISSEKPIVALESTIYTHGFPYPENLALAHNLENLVRENGAIPATIGILRGQVVIGLTSNELEELMSNSRRVRTLKVSRRDLGYICGMGLQGQSVNGGTTVAATALLAQREGIRVFATGGLGGVHRGGEQSLDISTDLTELGRTPIAVIASGCKSFLDIGRTLEYLETQGVFVGTFSAGRIGDVDFPAFFSQDSGFRSPNTVIDEKAAAAMIHAQTLLGLQSGMIFANPVPRESEIPRESMEAVFNQAIAEAHEKGFRGSSNTPFVLSRIRELTRGSTVHANRALIESNVARAAKVAVELSSLSKGDQYGISRTTVSQIQSISKTHNSVAAIEKHSAKGIAQVDVVVAGAVALDISCDLKPTKTAPSSTPELATSNQAKMYESLGGVGSNIARSIQLSGAKVRLCSRVGNDNAGQTVMTKLQEYGIDTSSIIEAQSSSHQTSRYVAVNDLHKDLFVAMADMSILEEDSKETIPNATQLLENLKPKWLVLDANWSSDTIQRWAAAAKAQKIPVALEPVSVEKAKRLFYSRSSPKSPLGVFPNSGIAIASPNATELAAFYSAAQQQGLFESQDWWSVINHLNLSSSDAHNQLVKITNHSLVAKGIPQQSIQLLPFIPTLLTKLGADGVLLTQLLSSDDPRLSSLDAAPYIMSRAGDLASRVGGVYMRHFPAVEKLSEADIVSVNGAGDTFLGIIIAGLATRKGSFIEDWVDLGQKASVLTLKSEETVSPDLWELMSDQVKIQD